MTINRRQLLHRGLQLSAGTLAYMALPPHKALRAAAAPHRFLQVFLQGGWDSYLATDPIIGSKVTAGLFDAQYNSKTVKTVTGKSALQVGAGFHPALEAFASMPTAFINGMYVEVTAHELATNYMLTGTQTLTRSFIPTAFIATAAAKAGFYPPHVVLGGVLPLGTTATTSPPLGSGNVVGLEAILTAPEKRMSMHAGTGAIAQSLTEGLNALRFGEAKDSTTGQAWLASEKGLPGLYAKDFGSKLAFNSEIQTRYGSNEATSTAGGFAGAFLVLQSGLSPFVTLFTHGFDTHSEGLSVQQTRQEEVAAGLNRLVKDLTNTPDPDAPQMSLAETTTILLHSEFVRSPTFNIISGSDHWQSASAILMGKGVKDNVVVGRTDDAAKAMGWADNAPQLFTTDTKLMPEHLAATILKVLGYQDLARAEYLGRLDAVLA